jgi:hypothetical protein
VRPVRLAAGQRSEEMIFNDFLDIVLSPIFLITFGLVMAAFLPLLYSVWVTWRDNREDVQ